MLRRTIEEIAHITQKGLIIGIKGYRLFLGSLLGGQCRFYPSCSYYAEEALVAHGVWKGVGLILWRILRCNPFQRGGVDLVPVKKERGKVFK